MSVGNILQDLDNATLDNGRGVHAVYTVTSADATANTVSLTLDLPAIDGFLVQIYRSNVEVKADAVISASGKVLTIADGASTYALTAGDKVYIKAWGNPA